ncbi:hypothetical protein D3C73_1187830 [compost metagenome]
MIQLPDGASSSFSAKAEDDVCRPRPVTALTPPVARSAPVSALTMVDLPTPEWPSMTVTLPPRCERSWETASLSSRAESPSSERASMPPASESAVRLMITGKSKLR